MRLVFWLKATASLAGLLVLTGCPGEKSDPQPQPAEPRVESTGTLTDGVALRRQSIVARGATGLTRHAQTESSGAFVVNMAELTGPYLFANTLSATGDPDLILLTSVSTKVGPTNVTPLTTLLTAQVLGVTPVTAFQTFTTTLEREQITEENLRAAQADLTVFLQDALGVQVKSGTSSFVDSPFETDVGDPMYDTLLALNAKIAADGTTLQDVAGRVATGAQACLTEKIHISIGGQQKKFCPVSKSNVPEEADTAILDYRFRDISNNVLLVKVRDDTVLSAELTTAANVTYSCTNAACAGISLGVEAEDETRDLVFGSLALTGNGGGALLDGTFRGPPPSIELPVLPCTDNRYFAILSNHSVVADCIAPDDPFGYGATQGDQKGHGKLGIRFGGQGDDTGSVAVVVDRVTSAPVYVYFYITDPDTNQVLERFVCYAEACTGVTWGLGALDSSKGPTIVLRTITLDNTPLMGVDGDGNPNGESAVLKGSGLGFFSQNITDPPEPTPPVYPPLMDCDPAANTISVAGPGGDFNICIPPNEVANGILYGMFYDIGDGFTEYYFYDDVTADAVWMDRDPDGEMLGVWAYIGSSGEQFECRVPNCSGVTFSGPDANGEYALSFSSTVLRTPERVGEPPQPPRTVTLTSGDLIAHPL